ncbi:flagellar assembly protein FliW [Paenibacillus allorhizosphaerae]|uniref:Flagellar assembly factor FliW n=1 Tax=Paenibacillus allorhizosphaerae TaxID=2849866 RepID=A0ABM8VRM5_9BACL|nr:flagellar assembly protein FliW [Paenibacillus allorhizosphaerae]CAG7655451.1 Flagellar assembly factor FliW [Paenibacillus allorhizosphaerae]
MIKLNTTSLGEIEVSEEHIITFPEGIPGFADYRRFTLMSIDPELPFVYLQSVDEELVHFVIVNPFAVFPGYDIQIDEETLKELDIQSPEDVEVWCIMTIRDSLETATVNLLAPVIISSKHRKGKQMILHQSGYTTRHLFSEIIQPSDTKEKG